MVTWPCVGSIQQESFNRKKSALQNGNSCAGLPLLFVLDTKIFVTLIHRWRRNKLLDICPFHPHFYLYPGSSGDAVSYVAFLLIFHRMLSEPYGLDGKSITLNIHIMGNNVLKVWALQTLQNSGRTARQLGHHHRLDSGLRQGLLETQHVLLHKFISLVSLSLGRPFKTLNRCLRKTWNASEPSQSLTACQRMNGVRNKMKWGSWEILSGNYISKFKTKQNIWNGPYLYS